MISFTFLDIKKFSLQKNCYKQYVKEIIQIEGFKVGDLNFIFCSDEYLIEVNKQYLAHDYFTDIITFDYCNGTLVSGDIFISVDRVMENSEMVKVLFLNELSRIVFHGVLHLCGYSDKSKMNKEKMTRREDFYLNKFNL